MIDVKCFRTDEHVFHEFPVEIERECSGKTPCGEQTHQPHGYTAKETGWCSGICKCGLRSEPHGPGAHK